MEYLVKHTVTMLVTNVNSQAEAEQEVLNHYEEGISIEFNSTVVIDAREKAKLLGATLQEGINWTWANGFKNQEVAEEFIQFLEANNYDHRGIYTDTAPVCTCSVRFG